ncbi:MAG TPA: hypothetical protein VL992_07775 [Tepidisphaeraceae bacterium]|nr:hypothetical protein [Tepidisphaeraceae bacterium]
MALKLLGPWLFDPALVFMMVWPRNAGGSHGRLEIYLDVPGAASGRPALETDRAEPALIAAAADYCRSAESGLTMVSDHRAVDVSRLVSALIDPSADREPSGRLTFLLRKNTPTEFLVTAAVMSQAIRNLSRQG